MEIMNHYIFRYINCKKVYLKFDIYSKNIKSLERHTYQFPSSHIASQHKCFLSPEHSKGEKICQKFSQDEWFSRRFKDTFRNIV